MPARVPTPHTMRCPDCGAALRFTPAWRMKGPYQHVFGCSKNCGVVLAYDGETLRIEYNKLMDNSTTVAYGKKHARST